MVTLDIRDLWKAYNGQPALQGLNLEVRRGEMLGLLGPNGAGKTTTLRVVAGLLRLDRGAVFVDGQNIAEDPVSYKAHLGYMPEDPTLPDYLSPEEFLNYIARIRDLEPERREAVTSDLLQAFDLVEKRRDLIVTLSRGMRQKLVLACALLHEPKLMLLDEPLIGIDPAGQHRIKETLLAGGVVRFLIPGLFSASGLEPGAPFVTDLLLVLGVFFLPFLWWRTAIGYVLAVILGILTIYGQAVATQVLSEWRVESYYIIIPHFVFALLLIGSSVLAWRES